MTSGRAWPSCIMKASMFPLPATPLTRPDFNIRWPELIKKNATKSVKNIFQSLPAAGPASYGMTDTMGRMHSDAQFAGSSSVPAHVEMMGFLGMGNNPMVGASVAVAVVIEEAMTG